MDKRHKIQEISHHQGELSKDCSISPQMNQKRPQDSAHKHNSGRTLHFKQPSLYEEDDQLLYKKFLLSTTNINQKSFRQQQQQREFHQPNRMLGSPIKDFFGDAEENFRQLRPQLRGDELNFLNADNNSIKYGKSNIAMSESNFHQNMSIDQLFGSHYDSDKDEDYSMKEDLIQNTKTYKNDSKPITLNISKAEVKYLLEQQQDMQDDSHLVLQLDQDLEQSQNGAVAKNYVVAITRRRARFELSQKKLQKSPAVEDKEIKAQQVPEKKRRRKRRTKQQIFLQNQVKSWHQMQQMTHPQMPYQFPIEVNPFTQVHQFQGQPQIINYYNMQQPVTNFAPHQNVYFNGAPVDRGQVLQKDLYQFNYYDNNNQMQFGTTQMIPQIQPTQNMIPYAPGFGQQSLLTPVDSSVQMQNAKIYNQSLQSAPIAHRGRLQNHQPAQLTSNQKAQITKERQSARERVTQEFYPFQQDQFKDLIMQVDMHIQLLYQVLLSFETQTAFDQRKKIQGKWVKIPINDQSKEQDHLKYRVSCMLYDFIGRKNQLLKHFNLPEFEIPWLCAGDKNEAFVTQPQVSYFQSQLLPFAPMVINATKHTEQSERDQSSKACIKVMAPLLQKLLLPIQTSNSTSVKQNQSESNQDLDNQIQKQSVIKGRKFNQFDDNLLLIGLQKYGMKNLELIQRNFTLFKSTNEIKHRFKNITATKMPPSDIKRWKIHYFTPLNQQEVKILAAALRWFGAQTNRWSLISQIFLKNRSAHVLQLEFAAIQSDHKRAAYFAQLMLSIQKPEEFLSQLLQRKNQNYNEYSEIAQPCLYEVSSLPQTNHNYQEISFDQFISKSKIRQAFEDSKSLQQLNEPSVASIGGFIRNNLQARNRLDSGIESTINFFQNCGAAQSQISESEVNLASDIQSQNSDLPLSSDQDRCYEEILF